MNADNLLYWLRGFMERGGTEPWGPNHEEAVVAHATLVLADAPADPVALGAKALAKHPSALADWLAAQVHDVTTPARKEAQGDTTKLMDLLGGPGSADQCCRSLRRSAAESF